MTAIQTEFQKLLETERANRAREEETRRANLRAEKFKEDSLEESKRLNTAEIDKIYSTIGLQEAQVVKIESELDKIEAEIKNINADTKLTEAQRDQAIAKTWETWIKNVITISDPYGFKQSLAGGMGKSIGNLAGGVLKGALISA